MEKGNEEISEKAVSKDYGCVAYEEIRIEYNLAILLKKDPAVRAFFDGDYKLNNVLIPGYKDIGTDGRVTFILRKIPDKKDGKV